MEIVISIMTTLFPEDFVFSIQEHRQKIPWKCLPNIEGLECKTINTRVLHHCLTIVIDTLLTEELTQKMLIQLLGQ